MVRYRQGVVKLLNSLSRERRRAQDAHDRSGSDHHRLQSRRPRAGRAEDWGRIIGTYPYAMKPDVTMYDTVASATGTPLAWVRGDWFAFTASRPPLYYDLLKLPRRLAELAKAGRTSTW